MQADTKLPLSAVLITRNAASQLGACLGRVTFCDDIVVVDSGSDDETVALARVCGARVIVEPWRGFGPMKQFAVEQALNDWVLCIDADEMVSERLRDSIAAVLPAPTFPAYRFARSNKFMGRYLRHGEGYPDWSLRMFDRRRARWSDDAVHEKVLCDGPVGTLRGDLLHDSAVSLAHYLAKQERYTTLAAQEAVSRGKRASVLHPLLSPLFRFVKFYLFRFGFLDGLPGLRHILIGCRNSHDKYDKMLAIQRGGR